MKWRVLGSCLTALILAASACQAPPAPPEVEMAEIQSMDLRRAGVPVYFPGEYEEYLRLTREAKEEYYSANAKIPWFRDYEKTANAYLSLLAEGDLLLRRVESFKSEKSEASAARIKILRGRMTNIRRIGLLMSEGKISRTILSKADILTAEAGVSLSKGDYRAAEERLSRAEFYVNDSENFLMSVLDRYNDPSLLAEWNKAAEETIRLSRTQNSKAIVVSKIDQTLTLYQNGRAVRTFTVSVGKNGLFDKKHAGDYATPEGKYRISNKNPSSRFHKALLVDYPNASDRQAYARNQKNGLIPSGVGIGGNIEIHGGGNDIFTDGCVSMTDNEINILYSLVEVKTPITIIGSRKSLKSILEQ